jgi:hypothetical protein
MASTPSSLATSIILSQVNTIDLMELHQSNCFISKFTCGAFLSMVEYTATVLIPIFGPFSSHESLFLPIG